jgi:hypothetical protein
MSVGGDDGFDFNTQTDKRRYCKKRVAYNFKYEHLEFCESEDGREEFISDSKYNHFSPKTSAVGYLKYGSEKFGKNKPINTLLDGGIGSFAEDRAGNTIEECLKIELYKLSFEESLRLISQASCPLCHEIECKCGTSYGKDLE